LPLSHDPPLSIRQDPDQLTSRTILQLDPQTVTNGFTRGDAGDSRAIQYVDDFESLITDGDGNGRFLTAALTSTLNAGDGWKSVVRHRE
jgi:hypothetical protein